jgi:hypothetical protein
MREIWKEGIDALEPLPDPSDGVRVLPSAPVQTALMDLLEGKFGIEVHSSTRLSNSRSHSRQYPQYRREHTWLLPSRDRSRPALLLAPSGKGYPHTANDPAGGLISRVRRDNIGPKY